MSMKLTQVRTWWDADDAYLIISFLHELSDSLWATYGGEIIEQLQANQCSSNHDDRQLPLPFEDVKVF